MTAAAIPSVRFDIGRVVGRVFSVIGRNWLVFGLLALLLGALPQTVITWQQMAVFRLIGFGNPNATPDPSAFGSFFLGYAGAAAVVLVCLFILQAALVHGVVADLNGRKPTFGECLGSGLRFFLPLLAIAILAGIAVAFGFLLFIVPGVLMALAWMVVVPAEVVERKGVFGAFSRSAELTRGHRGSLFLLVLIYWVLSWILGSAMMSVTGPLLFAARQGLSNLWPMFAANALAQLVQSVIGAVGIASIYYELRMVKEGIGPDALASVFD